MKIQVSCLLLFYISSLRLLTLSACETAKGNEQAVLGLAGVALKTGTNSILGTLWQVQDNVSLRLIKNFYENLDLGFSPAKALQLAQISEIDNMTQHPKLWSAFLLIGF